MQIFDMMSLKPEGYENRNANVFYQHERFKTRIIVLEPGGKIPECLMETHVIFYVIEGNVVITKNGEASAMRENQVFITEPATLSMESALGARLLGIQINTAD